MRMRFLAAALVAAIGVTAPARAGDEYALDAAHSAVTFKISHAGLSWTYGRFKEVGGAFIIDTASPANTSFTLNIKAESIDTDSPARDQHLRSPDFFNVKQFPTVFFKSSTVAPIEGGYQVSGELTLHGVARPVSFKLIGGRTAEFPKGVTRTGFSTDLVLKRSEFGMDKAKEGVGDDVYVGISFEGTKK